LHKSDEAEKVYSYILSQDSEFVPALTNKGFLELTQGHVQLAKQCYDKALAYDPDDHQALMNTAGWYIYEKQFPESEKYLEHVIEKYPDDAQARDLLEKVKNLVHTSQ
jgi:tetratricopeptide (TPR) repeat protein